MMFGIDSSEDFACYIKKNKKGLKGLAGFLAQIKEEYQRTLAAHKSRGLKRVLVKIINHILALLIIHFHCIYKMKIVYNKINQQHNRVCYWSISFILRVKA